MIEFKSYGVDWIGSSDAVRETTYATKNISRYYQASPTSATGAKLFPTTARIGLTSPNDGTSACIMTKDALGFGTYEVLLAGRIDGFDPNIVAAVWTHADAEPRVAGNVEVDFEVASWGDQNRRTNRVQLGVFVDSKKPMAVIDGVSRPLYPNVETGVPAYLYHRITLTQLPTLSRVKAEGWWEANQTWKDWAFAEWAVPSPVMGRFKVSMWRLGPNQLPVSGSAAPKWVVAGFKFTPA
jgi:hypothetical protein